MENKVMTEQQIKAALASGVYRFLVRSRPAGYTVEGMDRRGSYVGGMFYGACNRSEAVAVAEMLNARRARKS